MLRISHAKTGRAACGGASRLGVLVRPPLRRLVLCSRGKPGCRRDVKLANSSESRSPAVRLRRAANSPTWRPTSLQPAPAPTRAHRARVQLDRYAPAAFATADASLYPDWSDFSNLSVGPE